MRFCFFIFAVFTFFALTSSASSQDTRASMVVGHEDQRIRCSGGSELGWSKGDRLLITRGAETVGWATVQEVGEYQTWIVTEQKQTQIGDKVEKATPESTADQFVTRRTTFKAKLEGGRGFDPSSLFGLVGLYNLVDNRRWARRYGDGFYRTSSEVDLAVGVASFLFNQFRGRRGPRVEAAEARFDVALDRQFLTDRESPLELNLAIHNTGAHELQFAELDQHMYLKDKEGKLIEYFEMSRDLLEPIKPGESVSGLVRFPAADLGSRIRIRFEDILGKDKTVKF